MAWQFEIRSPLLFFLSTVFGPAGSRVRGNLSVLIYFYPTNNLILPSSYFFVNGLLIFFWFGLINFLLSYLLIFNQTCLFILVKERGCSTLGRSAIFVGSCRWKWPLMEERPPGVVMSRRSSRRWRSLSAQNRADLILQWLLASFVLEVAITGFFLSLSLRFILFYFFLFKK